jgi:hypothetical protein
VQQVALIKPQLPGVQRSLMAATAKLRTAGKWTSEFDSFVLDNLRRRAKTAVIETMTQAGGARALIDQVVSDVNQVGAEMDTILEELRPKNALQRLIEPVLGTPVSAQCLCLKRRAQKIYAAVYVMVCALHPSCS